MVSRASLRSREGFPLSWDELRIAAGDYTEIGFKFKFGFSAATGTTEGTVWGESDLYSYPASAEAMTISSSSADDTAAGTGARAVSIEALDTDYAEQDISATLNGQTGVSIGTLLRANRIVVNTAGSGGVNAGTLYIGSGTVTSGVPANIYATVEPGRNQTLMCLWTVPAGKTAFLRRVFTSTGGNANTIVTTRLVMRPENEVFQTKDIALMTRAAPVEYPHSIPVPIAAKTDIEMRAAASTGTVDVSATLEMVVVGD